jgi:hypothetical protein
MPNPNDQSPGYEAPAFDMAKQLARLTEDVKYKVYPPPFMPGERVGGIPKRGVKITDPRPGGQLTGSQYSPQIITEIVQAARQHHIDPALALAMSLQETTLGTAYDGDTNPLHENNAPWSKMPESASVHALNQSIDWRVPTYQHDGAIGALFRSAYLDAGMQHLQQLQHQYANAPEAHQIQAYNGLGKPSPRYTFVPADTPFSLYGKPVKDLEPDFYGKRVQDIRDNVVNQSPYLQQLIKGIN